jgi:hypothetical protein
MMMQLNGYVALVLIFGSDCSTALSVVNPESLLVPPVLMLLLQLVARQRLR